MRSLLLTLSLAGCAACIGFAADKKSPASLAPFDYSYCGYQMSAKAIPNAPVMVNVPCRDGDQSERIQRAIDYVSKLPVDRNTGMRGTILLSDGVYELAQPLRIKSSGIVLRGTSKNGTILRKTGVDRGAVIYMEGDDDKDFSDTLHITAGYTAAGKMTLPISNYKAGELTGKEIEIVRPSTKEWIKSIGCDVFGGGLGYWGWKPGEMDVRWQRTILTSSADSITVDAPLTVALDSKWGDCYALLYSWNGRIHDSGVENMTIVSDAISISSGIDGCAFSVCRNAKDEDHCWDGIYINNAKDCWVRQVTFRGLAGSAVIAHRGASQLTVEDCISLQPVSETGGMRRRTFLTMGGKCLFLRCYSENGINDFSAGYCAPGPNAFVQCDAIGTTGFSGSSSSWATGLLFDNVNIEGGGISFKNLELDKWGAGWNTANSTLYQCSASFIDCYSPADDARCYAIGCWAYCQGNGEWTSTNDHVSPYSLFEEQLRKRAERDNLPIAADSGVNTLCRTLERPHEGSSSPTIDKAAEMAQEALTPRITMQQWIEQAAPILSQKSNKMKSVDALPQTKDVLEVHSIGFKWGGTLHRTPWWNGRTRYPYMDKADYAVTRFVPGMEQRGGTDRMDSVVANIERQHVAVWNQNYGLWYDRRRDDHERIKRQNGDVWAPFFEQALARSGEGTAWDGLSLYDLTKLNPWYFHRINELATRCPDMLIINQHYFQHNILEAGAHWVDCPWRSANNIQSRAGKGTHFLEPVPFTGDKRIFTADLFYDVTDNDRAALYRQYIWNVLDATADNDNIYQSISEEYTGPQHFMEFWMRCIGEWEKARGRKANVILNATRDVQEAIMAQPDLAQMVDYIEIEQWFYDNGKLFAPEGGKNLAPRQHMRLQKLGHPTFADVYTAVSDMRKAYPQQKVLYYAKEYDRYPWAVVFAGGAFPTLTIYNKELLDALARMQPVFATQPYDGIFTMQSEDGKEILTYNTTDAPTIIKGNAKKVFSVDKKDGTTTRLTMAKDGTITINPNTIIWIRQ